MRDEQDRAKDLHIPRRCPLSTETIFGRGILGSGDPHDCRPSPTPGFGFVLRAEKLDEKLLVHNYGHGGSGMSLSWGTGYMAAETASQHDRRLAAVIGCGVTGLTTARQLQRRGVRVKVLAESGPPAHNTKKSSPRLPPTT